MTYYVYSTLACSNDYCVYREVPEEFQNVGRIHNILHKITIKGGTGVINKHLVTPQGVVTQISDEDMEYLLKDEVFNVHVKNGFITYQKHEEKVDKVVKDLKKKDKSAQMTSGDQKEKENTHAKLTLNRNDD